MYSKQIKYTQIHLYMKNLLKTLFVHYIYISNYIKRGLSTHFMRTFRNHDGGEMSVYFIHFLTMQLFKQFIE